MPMLGWEKKFDFKDLTFGVEIETAWPEIAHSHGFALPCRSAVEERLQAANLNWSVVGDASISGWELVSPILHYPDGIREIEVVCEILRSMDFTIDEHCGVHIHVGFPNDVQALRRLLRLYSSKDEEQKPIQVAEQPDLRDDKKSVSQTSSASPEPHLQSTAFQTTQPLKDKRPDIYLGLGLDFGTHGTKIAYRELQKKFSETRIIDLENSGEAGRSRAVFPSLISVRNNSLYFGRFVDEAVLVENFKMRIGESVVEQSSGLSYEDLTILFLA